MKHFWPALILAPALWSQSVPVYKNPDAPVEKRVEDLLSRMTLEEKVSQMMNASPAIERLDVPAYNWWNECLHGVARAGRATVFPEPIGLAATWDTDLIFRTATAISDEARAKHHEFVRRGKRNIYQGLTFWTPNINLVRDPRWGRGMETYGEDPYLTGRMAVQFIKGLQGDDPKYLKVVATAKHFAVHSGPEPLRHSFDARVDDADLRDTYLPQFEAAVREGGAFSVMCAYNRVNGDPACASPRLLGEILRRRMGLPRLRGLGLRRGRRHLPGPQGGRHAGGGGRARRQSGHATWIAASEYAALVPAVRQKLITEAEIDTSLRRLLTARFRLGMFDPPERVPYAQIPYSVNDSPEHRALALETARKSIVLLKNEDGMLPLRKGLKTIAVIGPDADNLDVLLGNYNGYPTEPVTPLEGIRRKAGPRTQVLYAQGSDLAENMPTPETVPSSALFTSDGPDRKNGLQAEYFNTANFNGRAYRAPGKPAGNSGQSPAAVHAHRSTNCLPLVGRRAPRRYGRRQLRRALDRIPGAAGDRQVSAWRHWHERVRDLARRQAAGERQQHSRVELPLRGRGVAGREAVPHPRGIPRNGQRCRYAAGVGAAGQEARRCGHGGGGEG